MAELTASEIAVYTRQFHNKRFHVVDPAAFLSMCETRDTKAENLGYNMKRLHRAMGLKTFDLATATHLVFPVCSDSHWTVVVVYLADGIVAHYDSVPDAKRHSTRINTVMWAVQLLIPELRSRRWRQVISAARLIPTQQDGTSCGVIACMVVHYTAMNARVSDIRTDPCAIAMYRAVIRKYARATSTMVAAHEERPHSRKRRIVDRDSSGGMDTGGFQRRVPANLHPQSPGSTSGECILITS